MILWPNDCQLEFSDDGAVLPPRKKDKVRKDGTFPPDKSKGKLKKNVCFADEFKDAINYNDIPEDTDDALDKHLPLEERDATSPSS